MIDIAPPVADWIAADSEIGQIAADRIYADELPEKVAYPAVLVRLNSTAPYAGHVPGIYEHEIRVDLICPPNAHDQASQLCTAIVERLLALPAVYSGAAFSGIEVGPVLNSPDTEVSPARPRWVITAAVTARDS